MAVLLFAAGRAPRQLTLQELTQQPEQPLALAGWQVLPATGPATQSGRGELY